MESLQPASPKPVVRSVGRHATRSSGPASANSRAGPSSNATRKRVSLGITMTWKPELTKHLLELVRANPAWRHTFFSRDSARLPMWREARDLLCLLCRNREHSLMREMERHGLVSKRGKTPEGGTIWEPTAQWNRSDIVTNRAESQLRKLRDDYEQVQKEYRIPDSVSDWKDIKSEIRTSLRMSYPFFMTVHRLQKYDDSLDEQPLAPPAPIASGSFHRPATSIPRDARATKRQRAISISSTSSSEVAAVQMPERARPGKTIHLERSLSSPSSSSTTSSPPRAFSEVPVKPSITIASPQTIHPVLRSSQGVTASNGSSAPVHSELSVSLQSTSAKQRKSRKSPSPVSHASSDTSDEESDASSADDSETGEVDGMLLSDDELHETQSDSDITECQSESESDEPDDVTSSEEDSESDSSSAGGQDPPDTAEDTREQRKQAKPERSNEGRKRCRRLSASYSVHKGTTKTRMLKFAEAADDETRYHVNQSHLFFEDGDRQIVRERIAGDHRVLARRNAVAVWMHYGLTDRAIRALKDLLATRQVVVTWRRGTYQEPREYSLLECFRRTLKIDRIAKCCTASEEDRLAVTDVTGYRGNGVNIREVKRCSLYELCKALNRTIVSPSKRGKAAPPSIAGAADCSIAPSALQKGQPGCKAAKKAAKERHKMAQQIAGPAKPQKTKAQQKGKGAKKKSKGGKQFVHQ